MAGAHNSRIFVLRPRRRQVADFKKHTRSFGFHTEWLYYFRPRLDSSSPNHIKAIVPLSRRIKKELRIAEDFVLQHASIAPRLGPKKLARLHTSDQLILDLPPSAPTHNRPGWYRFHVCCTRVLSGLGKDGCNLRFRPQLTKLEYQMAHQLPRS